MIFCYIVPCIPTPHFVVHGDCTVHPIVCSLLVPTCLVFIGSTSAPVSFIVPIPTASLGDVFGLCSQPCILWPQKALYCVPCSQPSPPHLFNFTLRHVPTHTWLYITSPLHHIVTGQFVVHLFQDSFCSDTVAPFVVVTWILALCAIVFASCGVLGTLCCTTLPTHTVLCLVTPAHTHTHTHIAFTYTLPHTHTRYPVRFPFGWFAGSHCYCCSIYIHAHVAR